MALMAPLCRRCSRAMRLIPPGKQVRCQPEEGRHREGQQGKLPAQVEQGGDEEDDTEEIREEIDDAGEEEGLDLGHVAGQARDEITATLAREKPRWESLEMGEDARAQSEQKALTHPIGEHLVPEGDEAVENREPQVGATR